MWCQIAMLVFVIDFSHTYSLRQKLNLVDWNSYYETDNQGPGTYSYGYDIEDPTTGNIQFKQEEKHPNGTVVGSYGLVEPSGKVTITHYVADSTGYRVRHETSRRDENVNSIIKPGQEQESQLTAIFTPANTILHDFGNDPVNNIDSLSPGINQKLLPQMQLGLRRKPVAPTWTWRSDEVPSIFLQPPLI